MNDTIFIDKQIPQWKGNFHTHTTLSDGDESPEHVIKLYKEKGYNFLAISDHEIYFDTNEFDTKDFLLLAGTESSIAANPNNKWRVGKEAFSLHFHGIYDHSSKTTNKKLSHLQKIPQSIDTGVDSWNRQIEFMREHNLMVFLNHPRWSRIKPELLLALQGHIATEVYNHSCFAVECTGFSEYEWDYALANGKKLFCIGTDDTHHFSPDKHEAFGGFTVVSAPTLSKSELCKAIKTGKMYASSGPLIRDMRITDGVFSMSFSPAQYVSLVAFDGYIPVARSSDGTLLESLSWPIKETRIKYFRPEVVDINGQKAWGQPVYL